MSSQYPRASRRPSDNKFCGKAYAQDRFLSDIMKRVSKATRTMGSAYPGTVCKAQKTW